MTEHCINASIRDWIIQDRVEYFRPSNVDNCNHNRQHEMDPNNCDHMNLPPLQPPPDQHLPTWTNLTPPTPTQNPISNGERLSTTTSTTVTNPNPSSDLDNLDCSTRYEQDLSDSCHISTYPGYAPFFHNLVTPQPTKQIENITRPSSTILIAGTKSKSCYAPPDPCPKSSSINLFDTHLSSPNNNTSSPSYQPPITPDPNITVRKRIRQKPTTPGIEGVVKRKMMKLHESKSGTPTISTDLVGKRIEVCFEYILKTGSNELRWCRGEVLAILSQTNHVTPVSKNSKKQAGILAKIRWDANPATGEKMVVTKEYLSLALWSRRGKVSPNCWRYEFTG